MSFIPKNPLIIPQIEESPSAPIPGTRGLFAKPDGWYDIDSSGNEQKLGSGGGGGGTPGEPGKDGKDGEDGISCTHSWNGTVLTVTSASGTSSADLKGDKGDKGQDGHTPVKDVDYFDGEDGVGVESITQPVANEEDSGLNEIEFYLTDGNSYTVYVRNGSQGKDGADGQDGANGADGLTPRIAENGNWWIGTADTGVKAKGTDGVNGINGVDGKDGSDGVGINNISCYESTESGGTNQININMTDGNIYNFNVQNGKTPVKGVDYWTEDDKIEIKAYTETTAIKETTSMLDLETNKIYKITIGSSSIMEFIRLPKVNSSIQNQILIYLRATEIVPIDWGDVVFVDGENIPTVGVGCYRIICEYHPALEKWVVGVIQDGVVT